MLRHGLTLGVISCVLSSSLCQRNGDTRCVKGELNCTFTTDFCDWNHHAWILGNDSHGQFAELRPDKTVGKLVSPMLCAGDGAWCLTLAYWLGEGRRPSVYTHYRGRPHRVWRTATSNTSSTFTLYLPQNTPFKVFFYVKRKNKKQRITINSTHFQNSPCPGASSSTTSLAPATPSATPSATSPSDPAASASADLGVVVPVTLCTALLGLLCGLLIGMHVQKKRQANNPYQRGQQSTCLQQMSVSEEDGRDDHHYKELVEDDVSDSAHIHPSTCPENV
ncbi:uncharacterized protein LOC143301368 [Babylonia areolata]|uniref:uncharacterized protein LOC143301368 n=1 Tax=Babylonia areolata TaxID=304850 RepID=UPI003FCFC337